LAVSRSGNGPEQIVGEKTAHELLNHPWIANLHNEGSKAAHYKKQQLGRNSPTPEEDVSVRLSLKELLNVSSDWKQINNLKTGDGGAPSGNALSIEFQNKQIERIVEAIGLTLPAGGQLNASMLGGLASGNTLSTANLDVPGGNHDYNH
jgi:hypothetical protein